MAEAGLGLEDVRLDLVDRLGLLLCRNGLGLSDCSLDGVVLAVKGKLLLGRRGKLRHGPSAVVLNAEIVNALD